ncbi:MAG: DUF1273 family protein [Oscillospiraceae bacterium]|nr:DUF1273 family protein [Oscillospiraceae bacterium]
MINKTVCFSGHRPEKLPGRGDDTKEETLFIKNLLRSKIEDCINKGYTRFLSGVARGIDLWAAETVIELRRTNPQIELVCVKPIQNQGFDFPYNDKKIYDKIISSADHVICTSDVYKRNCYMIRNKYMVDNAAMLIAFVKNYRSGTGQTINYAKKLGINTDITDLNDIAYDMSYTQLSL